MNKDTKGILILIGTATASALAAFILKDVFKSAERLMSIVEELDDEQNYASQANDYVDPTGEDDTVFSGSTEPTPTTYQRVVIGDGEGEISRLSKEYAELVNEYYGLSLSNDGVQLVLYGKTNGLGARGASFEEEDGTKGRIYNAKDIVKLRQRMLEGDSPKG